MFTAKAKLGEPMEDVTTRTFFVFPARRRGIKALIACVAPMTLVLNYFSSSVPITKRNQSIQAHKGEKILLESFFVRAT